MQISVEGFKNINKAKLPVALNNPPNSCSLAKGGVKGLGSEELIAADIRAQYQLCALCVGSRA